MAEGSRNLPTAEQRRAADPASSVWVTASAGTGKTRVLADRVLRLLLASSEPQQILCLTFTKAAAAEMVARVQADLGRFATLPDAALADDLVSLLARPATAGELANARSLLARVLDLPSGLPIMTIHGFCQSLLRRFPLEAGVPPHFDVIEPRTAADLLREAQEEVLASRQAGIADDLATLAVLLGEASLAEGLAALREQRLRFGADLADAGTMLTALYGTLGLPAGATPQTVRAAACADPAIDRQALLAACRALEFGSDKDQERCARLTAWLAADQAGRIAGYPDYETVFLRAGDRAPKQGGSIITGQAATPAAEAALLAEQARVAAFAERAKAAGVAERTAALLRVGAAVLERYAQRKARLAALDYDDLIERARDLLLAPDAVAWVQYKLDQQIDHLLVDEGQDTSPAQWAIVEALSAEFFVGSGARPASRTLFVVGDEKQSIMSVQGADVATYQRLRETLRARAEAGRQPWREEPLNLSFRSAPPILQAVDAVFAATGARDGVTAGAWREHRCHFAERPGRVEVWPLVRVEPPPPAAAWPLPDRHEPADKAEHCLARLIAERIKVWLTDEVPLAATGRGVSAGDVMILLPRRGILQDLLVRQLKRLRVPVAGADRLALTDEIAVMDLVALGDALLLPEDDLTLAAVLKSPLFGLGEDELFELAYERGAVSLYERLRALAAERQVFAAAHERFAGLLAQADYLPPFELYARLLGEGGARKRFAARLGSAALEPIEAFLAQALAYERGHPPSLQGFLHWLRADTTELIRDPDRPRDEVRVLTVHGAKGLEAPVVVLADTTFVPELSDRLLWLEAQRLPLWKVGGGRRDRVSEQAHAAARARQLEEQRRLLYVAMTRAQEQLIVTGWERRRGKDPSWYEMITGGLERLPGTQRVAMRLAPEVEGMGWSLATQRAEGPRQLGLALADPVRPVPAPAWLAQTAPAGHGLARPLSPSHLDEAGAPAASPLDDVDRYRRGRLIHRLLQSLPDRPAGERAAAMARFLAQPGLALDAAEQEALAAEVSRVIEAPELAAAFGPGSRAEVPLAGAIGDQVVAGQVDRLVVGADEVLVIDYKTDRAPATPERVPAAYLRQMAAYAALLRQIYPERRVCCALLWTQGPHLMPLDEAALASHALGTWQPRAGGAAEG